MTARDDETLLRGYAKNGDDDAFRELALRHGPLVYGACLHALGRVDLAEDAAQAVFLILARKAGRVRVRTTLVPWCLATTRLVCRGIARAERRRQTYERPLREEIASAEDASDVLLFEALARLKGPEREAVVLRFVQGLSLAEVGAAQGISEDAARMRVQRGLKKLRTELTAPAALSPSLLARLAQPLSGTRYVVPSTFGGTFSMSTSSSLAAAGALAVLTLGGAYATRNAHSSVAAKPASAPAPAVRAAVSPLSVSLPALSEPAAGAKAAGAWKAMLDRPFTLVYRVTHRNLRTKEMVDAIVERSRKDLTAQVNADRIKQSDMDKSLADLRRSLEGPPRTWEITVSYDGATLLFQGGPENPRMAANDSGSLQNMWLVADDKTYRFNLNRGKIDVVRYEGIGTWGTTCPFVGPSLPRIPIERNGKILIPEAFPNDNLRGDRLSYARGKVEGGVNGPVTRIVGLSYVDGKMYEERRLSGYRALGDASVAGLVVDRKWEAAPSGKQMPSEVIEYRLVSAAPESLPASRFDVDAYLSRQGGCDVETLNPNQLRHFDYDRSKGPLKAQIEAFLVSGR